MNTVRLDREPPGEPWPEQGLEDVSACPVCGDGDRRALHERLVDSLFGAAGEWTCWSCATCGSAYLDPRPTPATIGDAYNWYYTHAGPDAGGALRGIARLRRGLRNDYLNVRFGYEIEATQAGGAMLARVLPRVRRHGDRWIRNLSRRRGGGALLDVGCGDGAFVSQMIELGWAAEGIDPDPDAVTRAMEMGTPVRVGTLASQVEGGREGAYDAITLTHVVEHLHTPIEDLTDARRLLKPGGSIWIATPGLDSLGHRLFGRNWRGLEPPRHMVVFTARALELALRSAGFTQVEQHATQPLARRMFSESAEIRERVSGRQTSRLGHAVLRVVGPAADALAGHWPSLGEELVFTARHHPNERPGDTDGDG